MTVPLHGVVIYMGPGPAAIRTLFHPVIVGHPDHIVVTGRYFYRINRMVLERTFSFRLVFRFHRLPANPPIFSHEEPISHVAPGEHLVGIGRVNGDVVYLPAVKAKIGP